MPLAAAAAAPVLPPDPAEVVELEHEQHHDPDERLGLGEVGHGLSVGRPRGPRMGRPAGLSPPEVLTREGDCECRVRLVRGDMQPEQEVLARGEGQLVGRAGYVSATSATTRSIGAHRRAVRRLDPPAARPPHRAPEVERVEQAAEVGRPRLDSVRCPGPSSSQRPPPSRRARTASAPPPLGSSVTKPTGAPSSASKPARSSSSSATCPPSVGSAAGRTIETVSCPAKGLTPAPTTPRRRSRRGRGT